MKHKHPKRFIKLLFFTSLIPGALAAACTENGNNKNSTSSKSSDQASSGIDDKDLNNMQSDQPTETQPVGNDSDLVTQNEKGETQNNPTEFDDVNKLPTSIQVSDDYATYDAQSAWKKLKDNQELIIQQLQIPQSVINKYKIKIISDSLTFNNENEGKITNIVAEFKLGNQYQTVRFELTGFKVNQPEQKTPNAKESFLTQKEVSSDLKQLFPSILAQMLLFNDQPDQPYPRGSGNPQQEQLDYAQLHKNNRNYFGNKIPLFASELKNNFFNTNQTDQNKYSYKIDGVKFDDTEGTFSLNVKITNLNGAPKGEPEIEKQFDFIGFRKIDFKNPKKNNLGISILQNELTNLLQTSTIKSELKKLSSSDGSITNMLSSDVLNKLKSGLYKIINVYTDGNSNYYNINEAQFRLKDLGALHGNIGIYPFYSRFSLDDLIHNLQININSQNRSKKIELEWTTKLPILIKDSFGTLGDLSYATNPKTLDITVDKSVDFDKIISD